MSSSAVPLSRPPQPSSPSIFKLSWTEKLGYAAGDFGSCLYFSIFMNFLSYFYTDVFGISAAAVGTMILITRSWDWIDDPIMGMIADRTNTRMGKFRPWIIWSIVPYMVIGVLTFTSFDLSPAGKLVYAYVTYTLLTIVYTAINIPYSAMMGVISPRAEDRIVLTSYRFIGSAAANLVVGSSLLILVEKLGQGNDQLGFTLTVSLYALGAGAAFLFTFFSTKERVPPPPNQETSVWKDLRGLTKNGPWLVLVVVSIVTVISISLRGGATIYYFKYYAGDEKIASAYFAAGSVAQIVGVIFSKQFAKLLGGKKRGYILILLCSIVMQCGFYFLDPRNTWLLLSWQVVATFVSAPLMVLFWSMIADTADYSAWKFGHRSTGLLFSAGTCSQKIGWSIGPAIALWTIDWIGFVPNVPQSPETIQGLRYMMSFVPAAISVVAIVLVLFYKIGSKMEKELEAAMGQMAFDEQRR